MSDATQLRITRILIVAFFGSLPFHQPPVTTILGPALTLPEVLFIPLASVLAFAVLRKRVPFPNTGIRIAVVLGLSFLPSVALASHRLRAAAQLLVILYVVMIFTASLVVKELGLARLALRAMIG